MTKRVTKAIFSGTLRAARVTSVLLGLAAMLAVVLGVATTALAAVPGDPFQLGRLNAVSRLAGNVAGPMLVVDNNSGAAGATALNLQVEAGKAPIAVNAIAGKATNLDADEVDGLDADQLNRVARASSDGAPLSGTSGTVLSTKTTAPREGFVVIGASSTVVNNAPSRSSLSCSLQLDGKTPLSSLRIMDIDGIVAGVASPVETCSTDAVLSQRARTPSNSKGPV